LRLIISLLCEEQLKLSENHQSIDGTSISTVAFGATANLIYATKKDYPIFGDADRLK